MKKKKDKKTLNKDEQREILNLLADYSKTLTLLEQYDKNKCEKILKR